MKNTNLFIAKYSRFIILLLICAGLSVATPVFFTGGNLLNVLRQGSLLLIMSIGMLFAMLLGRGVDMSIGATLALTSCLGATFLKSNASIGSITFGVVLALFLGILIGIVNGALIAYLNLPAILVTFGMREIVRGIVYFLMNEKVITGFHKKIIYIGAGRFLNKIPMPIVIAGVITLLAMFILRRTSAGRELYIVGSNASAAKFSGIKTNKTIIFGFAVSGFMAALAGIVYIGRLGAAEPQIGEAFAFQCVGAVAIGGTSFIGGIGTAGGAVIGALILTLLTNGMNLLNISTFWQGTVNGAVIILAVVLDYYARKKIS